MDVNIFYNEVRNAVHRRWDPIGVAVYSNEMGEYDSYIPALCEILNKGAGRQRIFEHLWIMETDSMGMDGDREATEEFASWLYQLVESKRN